MMKDARISKLGIWQETVDDNAPGDVATEKRASADDLGRNETGQSLSVATVAPSKAAERTNRKTNRAQRIAQKMKQLEQQDTEEPYLLKAT